MLTKYFANFCLLLQSNAAEPDFLLFYFVFCLSGLYFFACFKLLPQYYPKYQLFL